MNNLYEKAKCEVQSFKDQNPDTTRADRFRILHSLCGIDEGTARIADRYLRAIREIYPPDEKCKELEASWKTPLWMHRFNQETKEQLNIKLN